MENNRALNSFKIIITGGALFAFPFFMLAYDDDTTHRALTQETVKLFNEKFQSLKVSSEDMEHIIQGSFDEDLETRWMQHFYDPVYNRGLTMLGKEWMSSKEWAQNTLAQARLWDKWLAGTFTSLFSSESDFSWDRAIYEYAWGDKKRGLQALGHVLHLIQDASVPDHTRNDPHPPILDLGSPYEAWTKKFDRNSINLKFNDSTLLLPTLNSYFDSLAIYSNNNFFSKDTITSPSYASPKIIQIQPGFIYWKDPQGNRFKLVKIIKQFGSGKIQYTLEDPNREILNDYWSLLSKQAILHGAGVIKLFFDEVEKEKRTMALYEKNRSWVARMWYKITNFFSGFAGVWFGAAENAVSTSQTKNSDDESGVKTGSSTEDSVSESQNSISSGETRVVTTRNPSGASLPQNDTKESPTSPPTNSKNNSLDSPSAPSAVGEAPNDLGGKVAPHTGDATSTVIEPSYPRIGVEVVPARFNGDSSPADQNGTVTGNNNGSATGDSSATSSPQNGNPDEETRGPRVMLTIRECANSLSKEACLIATTTVTLEWSSDAEDLDYFIIGCKNSSGPQSDDCKNFNISTTTATSTKYIYEFGGTRPPNSATWLTTAGNQASLIFSVKARDKNGNESETIFQNVKISLRPVVINEIAWAGTSARKQQDEWIELKNNTDVPIELVGMTLTSLTDGKPTIPLAGTIAQNGYYLIERTDDMTISDIPANLIASFGSGAGSGLSNDGEVLALIYQYATTSTPGISPLTSSADDEIILDRTPDIWRCGGWCGGSRGTYATMERYDPETSGENPDNWRGWQGFVGNGKNAEGLTIQGTPRQRNSVNYLIDPRGVVTEEKFLKKSGSPYIISASLYVNENVTLNIEPGVVIKFVERGWLDVRGKIIAKGTTEESVVFTSLKDDDYGGDTNRDGASTTPKAGDWSVIGLMGQGSRFENVIIRYGGFYAPPGHQGAALLAQNVEFSLKKSVIEESGVYGAMILKSRAEIEENVFRNNGREDPSGTGLLAYEGELLIRKNKFIRNNAGLFLIGGSNPYSMEVSENSFVQNKGFAVKTLGARVNFSGNTAEENGVNGIELQGAIQEDWTIRRDLPYVIFHSMPQIIAGKTLIIEPGTVIKLKGGAGGLEISGRMIAEGTPYQKIVFTSLHDDEWGGDTDATSTAPVAGDWNTIIFREGLATSIISNVIVRYGTIGLRVRSAPLSIDQSTVEKNKLVGVLMENVNSAKISFSDIQNHRDDSPEINRGLMLLSSSTPFVQNSIFRNNEEHIYMDGTSAYTDGGGNVFE